MDKEFIIIGIGCVAMAGYEIRYDPVTSGIRSQPIVCPRWL
jgi:hypothetical protein